MRRTESRVSILHLLAITSLLFATVVSLAPSAVAGVVAGPEILPRLPEVEIEPNNSAATATPIGAHHRFRGKVTTSDVEDFYSFTASAGDRVYAATMTLGSPSSTDSILNIIDSDGTTVLESDDNNGFFGSNSSSIAGRVLPTGDTYYIRVNGLNPASEIRPYDLFVAVRSGTPVPETEPNSPTPETLPGTGWVDGTISDPADQDRFNVTLSKGDTLFASLDVDPDRDENEFNGNLVFSTFGGVGLAAADTGDAGSDSDAMLSTVNAAGTYEIRVQSAAGSGAYQLSVTVIPAQTESCYAFASSGPTPIADLSLSSSAINVGNDFRLGRAALEINLNHANPPDLDVSLLTPEANEIVLLTDVGNPAFPSWDVRLSPDAATPVISPVLVGQMLQPESAGRLEWTEGESTAGNWTLNLRDDLTNNTGTLNSWQLILCEAAPLPSAPAVYSSDFETDDGGFTHSGTLDEWERGTPSFPPIANCNSGTQCWKTDLDNTYDANSSQDLVSPPIDLADATGPVYAQWAQRYQLENATFDHYYVDVKEVGVDNSRRIFEWMGPTMNQPPIGNPAVPAQQSAGWGTMVADISEFAGKTIELRFHLDSDVSFQPAGVAIDDVRVLATITYDLTVNKDGTGSGTVTSSPGISCGIECTETYNDGDMVTLTAAADPGSSFTGWSDPGCPGTGDCVVTMDADKIVTATFDDASPPSTPTMNPLNAFRTTKKIPLGWSASTDAQSGVASYELMRRVAEPNQDLGAPQSVGSFPGTSAQVNGQPGRTYCFTVEAVNGQGIHSDPSAEKCTSLPLDDRVLKRSRGDWSAKTGKGLWLNTFVTSKEKGATLSKTVTAKSLALVATKCPNCGKVSVSFAGDKLKTFSLSAPNTQKKRVLPLTPFANRKKGKFVVKILTDGKPVSIDGLGASAK